MALIRDALSTLPAKPALLAAPLIVIVVLSLYYRDLHGRCADIRRDREALHDFLLSLEPGSRFRLADFTRFEWNRVRIVSRVEPGTVSDECLFDWNWTSGERESLIDSGQLSALIFGNQGRVVGYYELSRDRIAFAEIESQLVPETAVFRVDRAADGAPVALSPVEPGA